MNTEKKQQILNGLYGLLILKLKKTLITEETSAAFDTIRELVAELSSRYMDSSQPMAGTNQAARS